VAHTYVIQSVSHVGDLCTVVGTIDGVQVTATGWFSLITAAPNALAAQTIMAGWILAALPPAPTVTAIYDGTIVV
jgi:hypothetical protein